MEKAFIVFSCNEWKEYASMRIVAVCKNMNAVHRVIEEEVHRGDMEIDGGDVSKFDDLRELNTALTYGDVQVYDVED